MFDFLIIYEIICTRFKELQAQCVRKEKDRTQSGNKTLQVALEQKDKELKQCQEELKKCKAT